MPERRVVITGMGVVTPVGNGLEEFWSNLKNGVSGIRTIDAFDTTGYDCKIGGQVRDFDPKLEEQWFDSAMLDEDQLIAGIVGQSFPNYEMSMVRPRYQDDAELVEGEPAWTRRDDQVAVDRCVETLELQAADQLHVERAADLPVRLR